MKKSLALLGFALAVAGCTSENDTTVEKNAAMNSMFGKPAGTYGLVPHTVTKDKKDVFTGGFDLVVKQAEFLNNHAFDKSGKEGSSLCDTFRIYNSYIDNAGKMKLSYSRYIPGRYGHTEYASAPLENMEPATLLSIPNTITSEDGKLTYTLTSEAKTVCWFTPK